MNGVATVSTEWAKLPEAIAGNPTVDAPEPPSRPHVRGRDRLPADDGDHPIDDLRQRLRVEGAQKPRANEDADDEGPKPAGCKVQNACPILKCTT